MRALALTILLAMAGCGSSGSGHGGGACRQSGIVLLSWTLGGQPPTADQGCTGIGSLTADLSGACGDVEIEPIPCTNGRSWRYDGLPDGEQLVTLTALDANKRPVAQGSVSVSLDATVPPAPAAIDLR